MPMQTLQRGLDEDADDKQCALACIRVDEAGLAEFYELFRPERYGYEKNSPCCEFQYPVKEHLVELSFRMNEAGLSKMGTDWLRQLKERLDSGEWLTHTPEGEPEGVLTGDVCGPDPPHWSCLSTAGRRSVFSDFPESGRHKGGCLLVLKKKQRAGGLFGG